MMATTSAFDLRRFAPDGDWQISTCPPVPSLRQNGSPSCPHCGAYLTDTEQDGYYVLMCHYCQHCWPCQLPINQSNEAWAKKLAHLTTVSGAPVVPRDKRWRCVRCGMPRDQACYRYGGRTCVYCRQEASRNYQRRTRAEHL